jgi:hypothetical protein
VVLHSVAKVYRNLRLNPTEGNLTLHISEASLSHGAAVGVMFSFIGPAVHMLTAQHASDLVKRSSGYLMPPVAKWGKGIKTHLIKSGDLRTCVAIRAPGELYSVGALLCLLTLQRGHVANVKADSTKPHPFTRTLIRAGMSLSLPLTGYLLSATQKGCPYEIVALSLLSVAFAGVCEWQGLRDWLLGTGSPDCPPPHTTLEQLLRQVVQNGLGEPIEKGDTVTDRAQYSPPTDSAHASTTVCISGVMPFGADSYGAKFCDSHPRWKGKALLRGLVASDNDIELATLSVGGSGHGWTWTGRVGVSVKVSQSDSITLSKSDHKARVMLVFHKQGVTVERPPSFTGHFVTIPVSVAEWVEKGVCERVKSVLDHTGVGEAVSAHDAELVKLVDG